MTTKTKQLSKSKISMETIAVTDIFTALISIISAIPIGIEFFGVPATLQTFAMSFIGFLLSYKLGIGSVAVYILLGLMGIPVFHGFHAGPSVLFSATGGFLFGFLFLAGFSGMGLKLSKKISNQALKAIVAIMSSLVGLIICHIIGIIQFSFIYGTTFKQSLLMVSLPYIPKDAVSVVLAYFIAIAVRTALSKANILPNAAQI